MIYCKPFDLIKITDIAEVGGKNASLGEMLSGLKEKGIRVPNGFAVTTAAYQTFLKKSDLESQLGNELAKINQTTLENLTIAGAACRKLIESAPIPDEVCKEIIDYYNQYRLQHVAVRSSATAEDLPEASFAGQHESFLNIRGEKALIDSVHKCYVSLFNDRAIKYRIDHHIDHMKVNLSVGIQQMIDTNDGCSGVAFTIEPESGNKNMIYITATYGLGENIVQGSVGPDEFFLFKNALKSGKYPIIKKCIGAKEKTLMTSDGTELPVINTETVLDKRIRFCIAEKDVIKIGSWCLSIEEHYGKAMDIEFAQDGNSNELYILQARPETIHSSDLKINIKEFEISKRPQVICSGSAVGNNIVSGRAVLVNSIEDADKVRPGDIIVSEITSPDWNTMLRKAVSIVTDKGGRTSHASIVARELGIHAVVGTGTATKQIKDGQLITVSCAEGTTGIIYNGLAEWKVKETDPKGFEKTATKAMLILADPDKALELSKYPNDGVGLMRMEFTISEIIGIHPMALLEYKKLPEGEEKNKIDSLTIGYADKSKYFTEKLSSSIAMIAGAFYPKDVILRMSDFKTNEYRQLAGGCYYEPEEENPMIGFRGASRYYNPRYIDGFGLECEAVKFVRDEMGLTNVKVMIPFCRTIEEGKSVLQTMSRFGLERGKNGLEVYVMAEIPSNVILASGFAEIFDGFSIGSNDLTQLTLGVDRDSEIINGLFNENNEAVKWSIEKVIFEAREAGVKIGLCGQAPSDDPSFAKFLVNHGIDSISFNPDALLRGLLNIQNAEESKSASIY